MSPVPMPTVPSLMASRQGTNVDDADGEFFPLVHVAGNVRDKVMRPLRDNEFVIRTNVGDAVVYWQVTGVCRDAWAEGHVIEVERQKPEADRGTYMHRLPHSMPAELRLVPTRSRRPGEGTVFMAAPTTG